MSIIAKLRFFVISISLCTWDLFGSKILRQARSFPEQKRIPAKFPLVLLIYVEREKLSKEVYINSRNIQVRSFNGH